VRYNGEVRCFNTRRTSSLKGAIVTSPSEQFYDIVGKKFHHLTVISPAISRGDGPTWNCLCDCEATIIVEGHKLRSGKKKSCGCTRQRKHGHATHSERSGAYMTWASMLTRCYNPEVPGYKWYGALGITVCESWHDFRNFLADMGERPEGLTLDRYPNNTGNYEPNNCRWATRHEQNTNTRVSLTDVEVSEIKALLSEGIGGSELARKYDVSPGLISHIKTGRTRTYVNPAKRGDL
jgi:hypothetical protein